MNTFRIILSKKSRIFALLLGGFYVLLPLIADAQYQPLTGIPGVTDTGGNTSLAGYVNALFILSVVAGALLAVIKIALGGFQYMMSDIITSKESAKRDITGALLGLGILLASVTILFTINKDLVNLNILRNAEPSSLDTNSAANTSTTGDSSTGTWPRTVGNDTEKLKQAENDCKGEFTLAGGGRNKRAYCKDGTGTENPSEVTGSCPEGEHAVLDIGNVSSQGEPATYICVSD